MFVDRWLTHAWFDVCCVPSSCALTAAVALGPVQFRRIGRATAWSGVGRHGGRPTPTPAPGRQWWTSWGG